MNHLAKIILKHRSFLLTFTAYVNIVVVKFFDNLLLKLSVVRKVMSKINKFVLLLNFSENDRKSLIKIVNYTQNKKKKLLYLPTYT